jgi:site-specific DNA-cytosine methylase
MIIQKEIRHFHLFCGLGGGGKGFNQALPRVGNMVGKYRCIGGVDVDPAAIADFSRLTGVPGTVLDLFDRNQYRSFHGEEPPSGWREAGPDDIRRAAGNERPHIVFLSPPCKGFSGLLAEKKSKTEKYQALNLLTVRGLMATLEAWPDDPPEFFLLENVPRIANRGRHLLDQITPLLQAYGYAVAETTHDCGELGGLAESRKRFLLVARHMDKVPPFLYEPVKRPLQSVGSVLGRMPMPGDPAGGLMHRIPSLQWKTWVRLAFVEAGSDWRSLNKLAVEDGYLRDYLIVPEYHRGYMGVNRWDEHVGTVPGRSTPSNGNYSVADPRFDQSLKWHDGQAYGVLRWADTAGTIAGQQNPGQGVYSVADPRHLGPAKHSNEFRIVPFDSYAQAVTSAHGSGQAVADPRPNWENRYGNLAVMEWEKHANTVIAGGKGVQGGYMSVADPRPTNQRSKGDHYLTNGHYGVVEWEGQTGAVSAAAGHDNGRWSIADPRLPAPNDKLTCVIRSLDGTWHRPFTTLELAAIQSLVDPEDFLELDGLSDQAWRERIGNAVPPAAAQAIAEVMGTTLLLAWSGETFTLSSQPIWVQPFAIALNLAQGDQA